MKTSSIKIISYVAICGALSAFAYWAGYRSGTAGAQQAVSLARDSAKKQMLANGAGASSSAASPLPGVNLNSLLHGPINPDATLLAAWVKSLGPKECLEALNSLQGMPVGQPRDDILKAVVNGLAEKDPKGFLASTNNIANARMREGGVNTALQKLGMESPSDALDWIKQNAADISNNDLARRYGAVMNGYATVDPTGALNAALGLPEDARNDRQVKSHAMEGIAEGMSSQGKYTDAIALFNQMPANKFQNDGLGRVADLWAVTAPQDTANWIGAIADPALQNDMGQNLTDVWGNTDPAAAAKWATQIDRLAAGLGINNNGNNNIDSLLSHVMDSWAKTDLNTAGQFLNQLPNSPIKDNAIASFAARAAQDDPASAMKWVSTITDSQARLQAAQQVAKQWAKQDPAAAAQFLSSTDMLTNPQKQKLAASLPAPKNGGNGQNGN